VRFVKNWGGKRAGFIENWGGKRAGAHKNSIMFRRKIEKVFEEWKNEKGHKPLVVKGVRQCGKTSSVLDFARRNYGNVIYLDFREHPEYQTFFSANLSVSTIILRITASIPEAKIEKGTTCFVFDEIQDCPQARSALKYFHLDGQYDVICTGSLLGVHGYKQKIGAEDDYSIPVGFEHIVEMYPMDFEEWLWANGIQSIHTEYLRDCLKNEIPVDIALHTRFRELLLLYVIVGGMPESVTNFLQTGKIGSVLTIQRRIVDEYKSDMLKYAAAQDKSHIRECFESIPSQLAREYKKFTFSAIRKNGRSRDYAGSLQWIEDAGIIRRCHNLTITELPLDGNRINGEFKVYMSDIGLLVCQLENGTQADILNGNLLGYKGAIFENLIADFFGKAGRKLYYYHKDGGVELDFVIRWKGKCTPVECKATTGDAKSMKTVLAHPEKYHVEQAVKFGDYNIGRNGPLLTLPLYMGFLFTEE